MSRNDDEMPPLELEIIVSRIQRLPTQVSDNGKTGLTDDSDGSGRMNRCQATPRKCFPFESRQLGVFLENIRQNRLARHEGPLPNPLN
jgi:hypothetical protein